MEREISKSAARSLLEEAVAGRNKKKLLGSREHEMIQAYRVLHGQLRAGDMVNFRVNSTTGSVDPYVEIVLKTSGGKEVTVLHLISPNASYFPRLDDLVLYDAL
jgi:hypothetical protein